MRSPETSWLIFVVLSLSEEGPETKLLVFLVGKEVWIELPLFKTDGEVWMLLVA